MVTKQQRQRQLAREKFERQQQRRGTAQARRRRRNQVIAAVAAVVVVAGGGAWLAVAASDDDDKSTNASASNTPTTQPSAPQSPTPNAKPKTCAAPAPGEPTKEQFGTEPAMSIDTNAAYTMTLKTTCGEVKVALEAAKAPHTVNSFAFLAGKKFFDHTKCHRLTTGGLAVLQCGDPTGTGTGGPGYKFVDENLGTAGPDGSASYPAGTVAMANSGPGTNGSQFFLVTGDSKLPPNYTPFGKVTGGMDVLTKIAAAGTEDGGSDGAPHENVVLDSVTVAK
ncbi:peptidylprolyl isomerase [Embleya scabrispora]|uniref:peptidylprolyl isomerase n=1 Tax=Embleya scabrispora TaxID=159449 RepID=UPI00038228A2|nr:peptidylprolyl isomerase [Embleya scabrispora]MYS79002.1 peptidylprolyl isomerase [Streptomyces sp. SID5474]